jgi:aminoglycoside 6'-N-acetyltransferase I
VSAIAVRMPEREDFAGWLALRETLWPSCPRDQHELEMGSVLADADRSAAFVAGPPGGPLTGFVEVGMRPWADGCDTWPVAYIEGLFVVPEARGGGVAKALMRAAEAWGADRGCREIGSDTEVDNTASRALHSSLGYEEVEVLVHLRKRIVPERAEGDDWVSVP